MSMPPHEALRRLLHRNREYPLERSSLKARLDELSPTYPAECQLIAAAVDCHVAQSLLSKRGTPLAAAERDEMIARMVVGTSCRETESAWAVDTWASALGRQIVRTDAEVPRPPTIAFWVEPSSIGPGELAVLRWRVEVADRVHLWPPGIDVPLRGERHVMPDVASTYTLLAERGDFTAEASVKLNADHNNGPRRPAWFPLATLVALVVALLVAGLWWSSRFRRADPLVSFEVDPPALSVPGNVIIRWRVPDGARVEAQPLDDCEARATHLICSLRETTRFTFRVWTESTRIDERIIVVPVGSVSGANQLP